MSEPLTLPDVDLYRWQALRGQNGDVVVGALKPGASNRCACWVVEYDPATMAGIDTLGRQFQLIGPPGPGAEGRENWIDWSGDQETLVDVSAEYERANAEHTLRRVAALPPRRPAD